MGWSENQSLLPPGEEKGEGEGEEEDSNAPEEGLGLIHIPQHCLCYVCLLQCAWFQGKDKAWVDCLLRVGPSAFELNCEINGWLRQWCKVWQEQGPQSKSLTPL